ncbi:MAG: 2Fe-2S iron-sulfur cluster-binding protein [Thermodesulfobacteriota bacterium]
MAEIISLTIDGKKVTAQPGEKLLWVALRHGIYIPNLCALKDKNPPAASCRLCFVEIEGKKNPCPSCTQEVYAGMIVSTNTPPVLRLQRQAMNLILASHQIDCPRCRKNRDCELQRIVHHLKMKLRPEKLRRLPHNFPVDQSHPALIFNPNKCVLCGRCVWACREQGQGVLYFAQRGFATRISTFLDLPLAQTACTGCLACERVCPVGALLPNLPPVQS